MEIQYAVMIDTRVDELTGPAEEFISNLQVTRLNTAPVFGAFVYNSSMSYLVEFYGSEEDRARRRKALLVWALPYSVTYTNRPFKFADRTAGTMTISGVTATKLKNPLYFQIHRTTYPDIGLYNGSFCWITGTPNFGVSGPVEAHSPEFTNYAAKYLRLEDKSAITWVAKTPAGTSSRIFGLGCSGSLYVASTEAGGIMTSPDGTTWTARTSGVSGWLRDVAWSPTARRFVTAGLGGTILSSEDGITWTPRAVGQTTASLFGTQWVRDRFFAVGDSGKILHSKDGLTWIDGSFTTSQTLTCIAYGAGLYVATATNGLLRTSPDLITWTTRTTGVSLVLNSVHWNGKQFLSVGDSGAVLTSADGVSWTSRTSGTSNQLCRTCWDGSKYLVAGLGGTLITSPDGVTWTPRSSGTSLDLYTPIWDGARFVVSGNTTLRVSEGVFSAKVYASAANRAAGSSVLGSVDIAYEDVAGPVNISGQVAFQLGSIGPANLPADLEVGIPIHEPTGPGAEFVTDFELLDSDARFGRFTDSLGIWSPRANFGIQDLQAIASNGAGVHVAVGADRTLLRSTNGGQTWSKISVGGVGFLGLGGLFNPGTNLHSIVYANGLFVVGGTSGQIATSANGTSWTERTSNLSSNCTIRSIVWNGTRFVAAGTSTSGNSVSTSTDGTNWSAYSDSGLRNIYAGVNYSGKFVLVGNSGGVYTSTTGLSSSWTQQTSGTGSVSYRSVASSGSRIVAAGLAGKIHYSTDGGVNWGGATTGVTSDLRGIAWGGKRFVAVGASGVALKSTDGISWSSIREGTGQWNSITSLSHKLFLVGEKGSFSTGTDGFLTTLYSSTEDRALESWARASLATPFAGASTWNVVVPERLEITVSGLDLTDFPPNSADTRSNFEIPVTVKNTKTQAVQRTWKEGLIAKESLGSPSMAVDPSLGGSYSTMSGMDAKIVNMVSGLFNTPADPALAPEPMSLGEFLRQKDILLHRCKFRFYQVENGEFQLVNTFLIEDVVEDDQFISLQCADTWLSIHKDMPKRRIDSKTFPDAPEDSIGQVIPLCIGWVPEAKLVPLSARARKTNLGVWNGVPTVTTRGLEYGSNVLTLKTDGQNFALNQLAGKFIRVTRTGVTLPTETFVNTIVSSATSASGKTRVTLQGPFKNAAGQNVNPVVGTKEPHKAWWFQIFDFQDFRAVSDGAITKFAGPLKGWDDSGTFIDISRKTKTLYPNANSEFAPAAGILVRPEGDAIPMQPQDYAPTSMFGITAMAPSVVAKDAKIVPASTANPFPVVSYPCEKLRDGNLDTWHEKVSTYTFTAKSGNKVTESVPVRCVFPPTFSLDADEKLYVGIDADLLLGASAHIRYIKAELSVRLVDVFDTPASVEKSFTNVLPGMVTVAGGSGGSMEIRQIGSFYYTGTPGDLAKCCELPPDITDVLKNPEARATISGLEIHLKMITSMTPFTSGSKTGVESVSATYRIREVALFQERDLYTGEQYVAVQGVKFGAGWPGKSEQAAVTSLPDAIEYIIRRQDDAASQVEPLSFDFCRRAVFTQDDWEVGRQITESSNSVDYIEELCRHGFCSIVPGRDGKRRLLPIHGYDSFLEDRDFPVNRHFTNKNILSGSFKDSRILGMDRVYTGLTLKYDFNPASEEYRQVITVRNTHLPRFPEPAELVPGTTNPLWTTFVGGVARYEEAKALWGAKDPNNETGFRKAYLISQRENILELECPWFISDKHFDGTQGKGALNLARILSQWFAVPRVDYSFRVPASPYNLDLYLLQRITVRDDVRTNGHDYMAIITGLELNPVSSEIEVTCQRLLTDKPYTIPMFLYEGLIGEAVRAPEVDNDGQKVSFTTLDIEEVTGGDTLLETFYP